MIGLPYFLNSSDLFHLSRKKKLKEFLLYLQKNLPFASCINKNKSYFFFSNEIFLYSLINYKCLTILFKFNEKNDMFYKIFSF